VEFIEDHITKEPAHDLRDRIVDRAFEHGLLLLGCGKSTIRFSPPLGVTRSEIDEGLEIFEEAVTLEEKKL